jgi:hypothetical protein
MTIHYIMPGQGISEADLPIGKGDFTVLFDPSQANARERNGLTEPGQARPSERLPGSQLPRYPSTALKAGFQGQVYVLVETNAKGAPTKCSIVRTSGHSELDEATCNYALANLRYRSGTDGLGKPIGGVDLFALNWRLGQ